MEDELQINNIGIDTSRHKTIALFGATGTIGDGLLKAVMNEPHVERIHIITRRESPRIKEGVDSGLVTMTIHLDYLDYSSIHDMLKDVDTVYWAIGLSAVGLDEETYRRIHVDFPVRFITEWLDARNKHDMSFHYISGAGTRADSSMMWAREKARAETELFSLADGSNLRVISYRPSFILPTETEVHFGQKILFKLFYPIKLAVSATSIGEAMLEVSARGEQLNNGTILENRDIIRFSMMYQNR